MMIQAFQVLDEATNPEKLVEQIERASGAPRGSSNPTPDSNPTIIPSFAQPTASLGSRPVVQLWTLDQLNLRPNSAKLPGRVGNTSPISSS